MDRKLTYAGGRFSPNCLFIDYDKIRLVIDCGIEIGENENFGVPDLSILKDGEKITDVLLTHMNADHAAYTAALARNLENGAGIYAAPQTIMALPDILWEQMKISEKNKITPCFSEFEIMRTNMKRVAIKEPGFFTLKNSRIEVYANSSGHMPGAAYYIIYLPNGTKGFVSGDVSFHNQLIIEGAKPLSKILPKEKLPNEIWSTDLTYLGNGNKKSNNPNALYMKEMERLAKDVLETLEKGYWVTIPTLSMGRGTNIAVYLAEFLNEKFSVYIDGAIKNYTDLFMNYKWSENDKDFSFKGIQKIENSAMRRELLNSKKPNVYITTAGMWEYGPAPEYLEKTLPEEGCLICAVNWLAPKSQGNKILKAYNNKDSYIILKNRNSDFANDIKLLPLNATVKKYGCSAHCDTNHFIEWLENIANARGEKFKRIVLDHGEDETKIYAKKKIIKKKLADEKNILFSEQNLVLNLD